VEETTVRIGETFPELRVRKEGLWGMPLREKPQARENHVSDLLLFDNIFSQYFSSYASHTSVMEDGGYGGFPPVSKRSED